VALEASIFRVLLVEDYEPFRRFVRSLLQEKPELQIIQEASDGLEAVQKAGELKPDLILLDIGLPTLNGLRAARQIRNLSPKSKIIFVTQEPSADVAQEAFNLGALGYVVKTRAASELLPAVDAVCQGKVFVSRGLTGQNLAEAMSTPAPERLNRGAALPSPAPARDKVSCCHDAHFYPDDSSLVAGFTSFVETALRAGKAVLVIATEPHREGLLQRLQAHGVDSAAAIEQGLYRALDPHEMFGQIMVNDLPDPEKLMKIAGELITASAKAAKGVPPRVAACGECAPLLWAQGKVDAAIQLEHLWNKIVRTYSVDTLCGYVLKDFQGEPETHTYERICAEHSAVGRRS